MAKQQRLYGKMQKLDIYKNIAQIEEEIADLRKGIIYLDGRLADVNSKEWAQNHEEWSVYKRANKNYMSVLHQKKEALHKELNTRLRIEANDAIQANAVAAHTPIDNTPAITYAAALGEAPPQGLPAPQWLQDAMSALDAERGMDDAIKALLGAGFTEDRPTEPRFVLTRTQFAELVGTSTLEALGL